MENEREKIYKVKFLTYTNYSRDTVAKRGDPYNEYIDVKDPMLVKESDLSKFMEYGDGFESVEFVGYLYDI